MHIPSKLLTLGSLFLLLNGCASEAQKALDSKIAQQSAVDSNQDLYRKTTRAIEQDPDLSAGQKAELRKIRDELRRQRELAMKESLRLRAVLVQDTLSPAPRADEISLIRSKLEDLEERRLDQTFEAVKQAKKVLARQASGRAGPLGDYLEGKREGAE